MLNKASYSRKIPDLLVLLFGLIISAMLTIILGKDTNFDVTNYHFYNPFALLEGKLATDIVVADLQTFFNPLIDIPIYYLAIVWKWPAIIIGILISSLQSLNLFMIYLFTKKIISKKNNQSIWLYALVTLFTITGTAYIWEIGTLFGDALVSVFFLLSLYLILFQDSSLLKYLGWGILGFSGGLKYYYFFYILTFLGCYLITHYRKLSWQQWAAKLLSLMAGVLLSAGYWWVLLYKYFGNPFFPFMSNLFKSAYPGFNTIIYDLRYTPLGITDAFSMLREMLIGKSTRFGHFVATLSDPRVAFAWISGIGVLIIHLKKKIPAQVSPETITLVLFYIFGCAVWFFCFAMYRYAVVFELLSGAILIISYSSFLKKKTQKHLIIGILFIILILLTRHYPAFPRAAWDDQYLQITNSNPNKYESSLILFGDYMGFLAPLLGKTNTYIYTEQELSNISFHKKKEYAINQALQKDQKIYLLLPTDKAPNIKNLARYSLAVKDKIDIIATNISDKSYIVYSLEEISCNKKY